MTAGQTHASPASVIGIVTALAIEHGAVYAAFGLRYDPSLAVIRNGRRYDRFDFTSCDDSVHQLVIPEPAHMGNNRAAIATANLLNDFPEVQDVVLVGIAGAVPHPRKPEVHVRLGDVVMLGDKGVIQFDMVKITDGQIEYRDDPRPPSQRFLDAALLVLRAEIAGSYMIDEYLTTCLPVYRRPHPAVDVLCDGRGAEPTPHPNDASRRDNRPRLFIGPIGSSNTLLKDYAIRNRLRDDRSILAIEMESSGCADACQSAGRRFFAVRGTCDYCNQDKKDDWQDHAAYIAAATLHCVLRHVPGTPMGVASVDQSRPQIPAAECFDPHELPQPPPEPQQQSQVVAISAEAIRQPDAAPTAFPSQLASYVPTSPSSIAADSRPSLVQRAQDFINQMIRAADQLDFDRAEEVACECEKWVEVNSGALPPEIRVNVYTALARQALTAERIAAAEAGSLKPTHVRSKKFLALAQESLQ
jgi:nucleoside phosphorylase